TAARAAGPGYRGRPALSWLPLSTGGELAAAISCRLEQREHRRPHPWFSISGIALNGGAGQRHHGLPPRRSGGAPGRPRAPNASATGSSIVSTDPPSASTARTARFRLF